MKTSRMILSILLLLGSTLVNALPDGNKLQPVENEKVVINTTEQGLYNLVYKTANSGDYKVNIYNKDGKLVLKENFKSEKSFSKVYNFRNMAYGTYTMEIINSSTEKVIREIIHESSHKLKVDISSLKEEGKLHLVVKGVNSKPVTVILLDAFDRPLFNEVINEKTDFQKFYNVTKLSSSNVKFVVLHNGEVFEKNIKL